MGKHIFQTRSYPGKKITCMGDWETCTDECLSSVVNENIDKLTHSCKVCSFEGLNDT